MRWLAALLLLAPAARGGGELLTAEGERFPLRHTRVRAEISGAVVRVHVRQVFGNPYEEAIEAVYVFPLPHRAAVNDFLLEAGTYRVRGEIRRREEARAAYERARGEGKTAALLTQERPNVFTQNVANLRPSEEIAVELSYVETLEYESGGYRFVFPTTVGPRYNPPGTDGIEAPYAERPGHDIDLAVELRGSAEGISSPSHRIDVARGVASLHPADRIPNKDFVLEWRVAGEEPEATLLTHRKPGADAGHFALWLLPPADPEPEAFVPREVFFVLDCSGSMSGMPIETAKRIVLRTLETLDPRDTFQILRFSERASGMAEAPLPATEANLLRGAAYVQGLSGGGGTMMIEGIRAALGGPRDPERLRVVHFLTDGYIGNEAEIFAEVDRLVRDARIFPLGVGSSVNRWLVDGLARAGRGAAAFLRHDAGEERIAREVARFVERVRRPLLVDLEVDWGGLPVLDVLPRALPDLFAGAPVEITGRYAEAGAGEVVLRGRRGGEPFQMRVPVVLPEVEEANGALASLWARREIDETPDPETATALALAYRLMSAHTAFVAIEETVVVEGGATRVVRQPLPVPEGVDPVASGALGFGKRAGGFRGPNGGVPPGMRAAGGPTTPADPAVPGDPPSLPPLLLRALSGEAAEAELLAARGEDGGWEGDLLTTAVVLLALGDAAPRDMLRFVEGKAPAGEAERAAAALIRALSGERLPAAEMRALESVTHPAAVLCRAHVFRLAGRSRWRLWAATPPHAPEPWAEALRRLRE